MTRVQRHNDSTAKTIVLTKAIHLWRAYDFPGRRGMSLEKDAELAKIGLWESDDDAEDAETPVYHS